MSKEQDLYNRFVDVLNERLDEEPTAKDLEVVLKFLQSQNIQATTKHQGLSELVKAATALPFEEDDELPLRRVK